MEENREVLETAEKEEVVSKNFIEDVYKRQGSALVMMGMPMSAAVQLRSM